MIRKLSDAVSRTDTPLDDIALVAILAAMLAILTMGLPVLALELLRVGH